MQSFLKSSDAPETIIAKFDVEGSEESAEYRAVTTCFEVSFPFWLPWGLGGGGGGVCGESSGIKSCDYLL